jgi:hypothetical protein
MPEARLVAIHQPNFLPWLGFFDKLARCDEFVLLDDVQFPKKGGTWTNRVQIGVAGKPSWITVPIVRSYHGTQLVREILINDAAPWREKLLETIRHNYTRAPFFRDVFPVVEEIVNHRTELLADYNVYGIRELVRAIGPTHAEIRRSSELATAGHGTDLLISITKAVGGSAYLCGGGASGYQEDAKFAESGIDLVYQHFQHPTHPQASPSFIPGLSVVDAAMNCGIEGVRSLIGRERSAN